MSDPNYERFQNNLYEVERGNFTVIRNFLLAFDARLGHLETAMGFVEREIGMLQEGLKP